MANVKCSGCATTIKQELLNIEGVQSVEVDLGNNSVDILYQNVDRNIIISKLHSIGYPEAPEKN